ncbi:MAG: sodium:solute symporter family protein [Eggerthellaceae bacterium]
MNGLLLFGVGITVLLVLFVGMYVGRKVEGDSQNFLVAGRMMPVYLVAPALMVAAVDSNATVGNMDLTSSAGFWAGASLAIGMAIALFLSGIFVAKPMNKMGLFSLGDFFRVKFGTHFEKLASCVMVLAYIILLAGNLVACGYLFEYFLGIPYLGGLFITGGLVLLYTLCGGLLSDAYTAAIQTVITLVAAIILAIFVAVTYGFSTPPDMGPFDFVQLTSSDAGAPINWATLLSLGVGDIVAIDFQQRIYSAKNPNTARNACFVGAALTVLIGAIYGMVALTCVQTLGLSVGANPLLYGFLSDYASPIIAIIVLAGIVAASFSTASGAILGMSDMIVRNIAGFRRDANVKGRDPQLKWVRLCMIPLTLAGILIAARIAQTGILLTLAFDLMLCALIPALFGGLFWKRTSVQAVFASAVVGVVLRIFFFVTVPTVYGVENTLLYIPNSLFDAGMDGWCTFICFGASLVVFFVVAAVCPRTELQNQQEQEELHELSVERSMSVQALYERAVMEQRKDTLEYYQLAKAAGFPVEAELKKAQEEVEAPIPEMKS